MAEEPNIHPHHCNPSTPPPPPPPLPMEIPDDGSKKPLAKPELEQDSGALEGMLVDGKSKSKHQPKKCEHGRCAAAPALARAPRLVILARDQAQAGVQHACERTGGWTRVTLDSMVVFNMAGPSQGA